MKTKDIAYGGLMIATFIVLGFIFRANIRSVQTYLEVIKTIVVAVFIKNMNHKSRWIFLLACFVSCLIFESLPNTLIYNVPCIIGGWFIGQQKYENKKVVNYLSYFVVHSVMMIYEFIMFGIVMQINLISLYREQFSEMLSFLTNGILTKTFLEISFVLFTVFDSAFSSFVIFILTQAAVKRLNKIKDTENT